MQRHKSHEDILKRLKRAEGHLRRVIDMLESEAPCLKVAQQLHAVANAKVALIHDHIENCLDHAFERNRELNRKDLVEFKEISKYL